MRKVKHPPVSYALHPLPWKQIPAHSILLKELRSGRILFEHDVEKRLSPASLTKIMSALIILEKGRLDDLATVSRNAAKAPEDSSTTEGRGSVSSWRFTQGDDDGVSQ